MPEVNLESVKAIQEGWDSLVLEIDGEWIFRFPRRPEVAAWLDKEIRLLPRLAPLLPVPIPAFEILVRNDPLFVGYRKLEGEWLGLELDQGMDPRPVARELGGFLARLHDVPLSTVARSGLPIRDVEAWLAAEQAFHEALRRTVFPLLSIEERERAAAMFEDFVGLAGEGFECVLVHADLGPEHILYRNGRVTGVLDWSDACVGDPAIDFAWLLYGVGHPFARELLERYRDHREIDDPALPDRALFYHRLGPWHEVLYGQEMGLPTYVKTGLEGVRLRLPS